MNRSAAIAVFVFAIAGCDAMLGKVAENHMTVRELVGTSLEVDATREVVIEGVVWPNQHGDAIRDEGDPQQFIMMPWARGDEIDEGWRQYFDARMAAMASGGSMQVRVVAKGSLTQSGGAPYFLVSEFLQVSTEPRRRAAQSAR